MEAYQKSPNQLGVEIWQGNTATRMPHPLTQSACMLPNAVPVASCIFFLAPPTNSHLLRLPHDLQVDVEEATVVNSSILRCQLSEDADIHCNTTRKKKISSRPKTYF